MAKSGAGENLVFVDIDFKLLLHSVVKLRLPSLNRLKEGGKACLAFLSDVSQRNTSRSCAVSMRFTTSASVNSSARRCDLDRAQQGSVETAKHAHTMQLEIRIPCPFCELAYWSFRIIEMRKPPPQKHLEIRAQSTSSLIDCLFPTSQVRVVRFYHSCSSPPSPPSPPPPPRQSSSPTSSPILIAKLLASPLRQLRIAVGIPGPQPPAYHPSGHPWTSTASFRSQWAPLDLNDQILSPNIITKYHHKTSSQNIITDHHHKTSSQTIFTNHNHRPSSQSIITTHHHKASSQIIITDHFHKASSHNTSSQNIITDHLHKS